jgi:hypothetical protein
MIFLNVAISASEIPHACALISNVQRMETANA